MNKIDVKKISKEQIDAQNARKYSKNSQSEKQEFICVNCRKWVDLSSSFSHFGYNLHCINCVEQMSKKLNISNIEYIKTRV